MRRTNNKNLNKRLIFKSAILTSLLILTNLIWYIFFHKDVALSFNLGILCPILYGVFYFSIKKTRRKLKSKIKPYIYIPIMYSLFGFVWLIFSLGIAKVTNNTDTNQISETVIEKLEFKNFFLFNYNLSYPSRTPYILENKNWNNQHTKEQTIMKSKYQTNNLILFITLFLIQSILIFITEDVIYNYIKPDYKKHKTRKVRKRTPPENTIISNEVDMFLNFGEEKDINKFPKL